MQTLISQLQQTTPSLRPQLETVQQASTLQSMILAAWKLGLAIALLVVQEILQERGKAPTEPQGCPKCQAHLHSKGLLPRQLTTILGLVYWERRVMRCPKRCEIGQIAPFDKTLGIEAHQGTSAELKAMACALAVFVPFGTAAVLLQRIGGVVVCPVAIWHWVQAVGTQAKERLEAELEALAAGKQPETEVISAETAANPLVLGADGVMVPFRPQEASPKGKTRWQEVKVGILARLKCATNRDGQSVTRLEQRRLVAVRGSVDDLKPRLWSEALRQGILTAKTVVWISDGGRGFWRMFDERFAQQAVAVLDFYHAAQNLWKAARDWLDGRTSVARDWFKKMRHQLRHGEENAVLAELQTALALNNLPAGAHHTLQNVYDYLVKHRTHISYQKFEQLGLPLGSGMVESACKWLIQQCFKGVGMRWSEDGFDHLLFLRLAWVNNRFDTLFSPTPSPNG
jgi:hypothetical protein